jgi:hypothetical protein
MSILVNFPGTSAESGGYIPNASPTEDGLFSHQDKIKLDNIEANANNYTHPASHSIDMITETTDKKIMTANERTKLSNISAGANNYTHPTSHSIDMITETTDKKIMTANERTKLSGIEAGATKYVHPVSHPVSMISGMENYILRSEVETMIRNASGIYVPSDNVKDIFTCTNITTFQKIASKNFYKTGKCRFSIEATRKESARNISIENHSIDILWDYRNYKSTNYRDSNIKNSPTIEDVDIYTPGIYLSDSNKYFGIIFNIQIGTGIVSGTYDYVDEKNTSTYDATYGLMYQKKTSDMNIEYPTRVNFMISASTASVNIMSMFDYKFTISYDEVYES